MLQWSRPPSRRHRRTRPWTSARSGCGLWTGDRSVCCARLTPRVRAGTQSLCEALHRWICHRPSPPPPSTKPISAFAISAAAIAISTASIASISAARTSKKAKAVITLAAASPRGYVCRRARDALLHGQSLAAQSMAAQRYPPVTGSTVNGCRGRTRVGLSVASSVCSRPSRTGSRVGRC